MNSAQLYAVKQQVDQELSHFTQSLQVLLVAKRKFQDCINDVKTISSSENDGQRLLIPASVSLYVPGRIKDNQKFMVDIGTGYFVEKNAEDAILFYQKKIDKLTKESVQIQEIVKEKSQMSFAIDNQIRRLAMKQNQS